MDSSPAAPAKRPAIFEPSCWTVFLGVLIVGLAGDLLSKEYVFAYLLQRPGETISVIPGFLRFTLSTNPGIVFGIAAPSLLVLMATLVAVVVVVYLFAASERRARFLHVALAMVLAGSLGNAYDRLFSYVLFPGENRPRIGQVRDFIDAYINGRHWPTFNVADILLVVGVIVIILYMLVTERKQQAIGRRS
jgi:signal peptidase II